MFPALVGMNRDEATKAAQLLNVPRAGGDEPVARVSQQQVVLCSPRWWG